MTVVPSSVQSLIETWRSDNRPRQEGIRWPRDRWMTRLPAFSRSLRELPDTIDRTAVRAAVGRPSESGGAATAAFVVSMVWGYGTVGYGPFRVERVLRPSDAGARLREVAAAARDETGVDAYRLMANAARLPWLGPAFGTKFLYFCAEPDSPAPPLILDRLVAQWLVQNDALVLRATAWSTTTYERYLNSMYEWSDELALRPDELEERIFCAQAARTGGQWAGLDRRRPT
jgi:hypothetical protein